MARSTKNAISKEVRAARHALKSKGWTYQRAAEYLGYSYGHFAAVLTCTRISSLLLTRINQMPPRAEVEAAV